VKKRKKDPSWVSKKGGAIAKRGGKADKEPSNGPKVELNNTTKIKRQYVP